MKGKVMVKKLVVFTLLFSVGTKVSAMNDVNKQLVLATAKKDLNQRLLLAADSRENEVEQLLQAGADPNTRDEDGCSAMHIAAKCGRSNVIKVLHKYHANFEAKDDCKCSPLHEAAARGKVEVVRVLVNCGADVHSKNLFDWIPFELAIIHKQAAVVRVFIELRPNLIKIRDKKGQTPLHLAANSNIEIMEILLKHGLHVNVVDNAYHTPLELITEVLDSDKTLVEEVADRLKKNIAYLREANQKFINNFLAEVMK